CDVVGAVGDGRALLEAAPGLRPDIVVLDVSMPSLNGLDAARQLKRLMPAVKVIFLTVNEDPDLAAEAFRAGASGFVLKASAASELLQPSRMSPRGVRMSRRWPLREWSITSSTNPSRPRGLAS